MRTLGLLEIGGAVVVAALATACGDPGRTISSPAPPPEVPTAVVLPMTIEVEVTRLVTITQPIPVTVEVTRLVEKATPAPLSEDISSLPYEVGALTGTYAWSSGIEGQGCQLAVIERLLAAPANAMEIELACNRGAPSFNMGYLTGVVATVNHVAVYANTKDVGYELFDEPCYIVMDFTAKSRVSVTQIGADYACGFGNGVDAGGTYTRMDASVPKIGCLDSEQGCQ